MTLCNRKNPVRAVVPAGLALVTFLCTVPVGAAEADRSNGACRQETRRVAVWPKGGNPKLTPMPRYESREVTVCDGKVVSAGQPRN
jgi:hypothetical protein